MSEQIRSGESVRSCLSPCNHMQTEAKGVCEMGCMSHAIREFGNLISRFCLCRSALERESGIRESLVTYELARGGANSDEIPLREEAIRGCK